MRTQTIRPGAAVLFLKRPVNPEFAWPHAHLEPKRVLILESDPHAADALSTLVAFWGHQPHVVSDAQQALATVPRLKPDAVVTEAPADTLEGWRFAKKLHACVDAPPLLVAVAAWNDDGTERKRLRRAGFDSVLDKPSLFVGLRSLLDRRWRRDKPSKPIKNLTRSMFRLVSWVLGKSQLSARAAS